MATLQISDELKTELESRANDSGFACVSDYLSALLLREEPLEINEETERKLLEGLASPARIMTSADWMEMKQQFLLKHSQGSNAK